MAQPDSSTPQVVDPELVANLTRLLQIRGPLGLLNVLDTIVPVVNMGDVVTRTVTVLQPAYRTTDIFSFGFFNGAAAGTVLADTGALAEGIYDVHILMSARVNAALYAHEIQIRDAANTATLAVWHHGLRTLSGDTLRTTETLALELAASGRVRVVQPVISGVGESSTAVIFARRRT